MSNITNDTKDAPKYQRSKYLDECGFYAGPDGWSDVCSFSWDVGKTLRGDPRCSECGWALGDHRASNDACPAIPYEAAFPNE